MGTRGFIGFVVDDDEKIAYCQYDAYPSGVGIKVLRWLQAATDSVPALRERVRRLRVVSPNATPTRRDIATLARFGDPSVDGPITNTEITSWYQLLRKTQGNPAAILEAGVIEDASGFPCDSLFCEWGYLVDLAAERFEVYRGFQQAPHGEGRFASRSGIDGYRPVARVAGWAFSRLPGHEAFLAIEATVAANEDAAAG